MLFDSLLPQFFQKMSLTAYGQKNVARKREAQKRLDYYWDDTLDYLEAQLAEMFSEPENMVTCQLNIVKKIINQLAAVYRDAPAREIKGSAQDQTIFKEITESSKIDVVLKLASRYTKLVKNILLRPVWRSGRLQIDILTPEILDVVIGSSPEELEEILITDYGEAERLEEVTFSHWTASSWRKIDYHGNVIEQEENPYQVLPFIPIFDRLPDSAAFWLPGGADLIQLQDAINIKVVDLLYLLQHQSFGIGWLRGEHASGANLRADPGSMVELGEDGELGFASQKARISEVVFAVDKLIKWACVSNGLSASAMSTDLSDRQSGEAKRVDRSELFELRQDDLGMWRVYERQLFDVMRTVWNFHNPRRKISTSATLMIDFADPAAPVDPLTESQSWQLQLDMGVISQVDIAMRLNPDLKDRDAALIHLVKVKQEQADLQ
jgi:hypothetical protein